MGATAELQRIPPKTLAALRAKPKLIVEFLFSDDATVEVDGEVFTTNPALHASVEALPTQRRRTRALRWQRDHGLIVPGAPPPPPPGMPMKPTAPRLDLDKDWHALHYLLTGSARMVRSPLSLAILGGHPIGPHLGYGRARYQEPREVSRVALALGKCRLPDLRRRFDPPAMAKARIYPPGAWRDLDDAEERASVLNQLVGRFRELRTYYRAAQRSGGAMLLWQS